MTDLSKESRSLFRASAILNSVDRYGSPFHAPDYRFSLIIGLIAALLIVFLIYSMLASFPRRETVVGQIRAPDGVASLASSRSGNVSEMHVHAGDAVSKGELLAVVTTDPADPSGKAYGQAREDLIDSQSTFRTKEIESQINKFSVEAASLASAQKHYGRNLVYLREEERLLRIRVQEAQNTVRDLQGLLDEKYISQVQFRQYEYDRVQAEIALNGKLRELELQVDLLSSTAQKQATIAHEVLALEARLAQDIAQSGELRMQVASERRVNIISPVDGIVSSTLAEVGSFVDPSVKIISIEAKSPRFEAELWVPSRSIGLVEVGAPVNIMLDSFPYQRFGVLKGNIIRISKFPVSSSNMSSMRDSKEPAYLVIASISEDTVRGYDRDWQVSSGMSLAADIVLEKRSLLEWIADPIRAFGARNARASAN